MEGTNAAIDNCAVADVLAEELTLAQLILIDPLLLWLLCSLWSCWWWSIFAPIYGVGQWFRGRDEPSLSERRESLLFLFSPKLQTEEGHHLSWCVSPRYRDQA
jgi:hypothetical protein